MGAFHDDIVKVPSYKASMPWVQYSNFTIILEKCEKFVDLAQRLDETQKVLNKIFLGKYSGESCKSIMIIWEKKKIIYLIINQYYDFFIKILLNNDDINFFNMYYCWNIQLKTPFVSNFTLFY